MAVRYDAEFRALFALAREEDDFVRLLEYFEYQQAIVDNMDYLRAGPKL